jgi:LysM repeat protein
MKKQSVSKKDIIIGLGIGLGVGLIALVGILLLARPWRLAEPVAQVVPSPTNTRTPVAVVVTDIPSATPIPSPSPTTTVESIGEPSEVITYTVQEKDTLSDIAYRFDVSVEVLRAVNGIDGDIIYPGQKLLIPSGESPTSLPTSTPVPEGGTIVHIVQSGEVLSTIAEHYGVTVEEIQAANGLATSDKIQVGQSLIIPVAGTSVAIVWHPSILEGDLASAYTATVEMERFTLHYTPGTYPAQDPQAVADMVARGLGHIETVLNAHLDGRFDVYAAGNIFTPPNQALRGHSFSAVRRYFFLHDGTGDKADQQYIATHELTHLFTWNVFGHPVSAMLSEGAGVYAGMTLIADSDHIPIEVFCAAYHQAGQLPRVSGTPSFQGHIRDLPTYYAAGCFVQYLIETYGPEKFGQFYPTGDYTGVYSQSLAALEQEWISHIEASELSTPFAPSDLIEAVDAIGIAYDELFANFQGTQTQMAAYLELDKARLALLEGRLEDSAIYLAEFRRVLNSG